MNTYFSTFVPGIETFVETYLKKQLPDVEISHLLSGLVVYRTAESEQTIIDLPIFNNSFLVLKIFNNIPTDQIVTMIKETIFDTRLHDKFHQLFKSKTGKFRFVTQMENNGVSINKLFLAKIEQLVLDQTKLELDRMSPDYEFWLTYRSEGYGFLSLRLTKHPTIEKSLPKGSLRAELSHILCQLSEPDAKDIVLDPFVGYGSIIKARVKYPFTKIICGDLDQTLVDVLKTSPFLAKNKDIEIIQMDATKLESIKVNSVSKIITDPPWGIFDESIDLYSLYPEMLKTFDRVLTKDGKVVILTASPGILESNLDHFKIDSQFDILVSGKKARIFVLSKI